MVVNNICTNGMLNCTDTIGRTIGAMTLNVTGDLFITFLCLVLILFALAIMFGIRLEWTSIIIMPLLIGLMAVSNQFIAVGAMIMIYLAAVITGNFLIR